MIKILGNAFDKTGNNVIVKYSTYVGAGPKELLSLYYRGMADCIDDGHAGSQIEIHNNCRAVYAEMDNKVVGACVIDWDPTVSKSVYIVFTIIDKDYRGRGLYKIIFDYLEQEARRLGAMEITSTVHINNEKNLVARKSVGMMPVVYKTQKQLNN